MLPTDKELFGEHVRPMAGDQFETCANLACETWWLRPPALASDVQSIVDSMRLE
jgi:hypothetical protein